MADSSWLVIEELFERSDNSFVKELRGFHEPDRLGTFSAKWFADRRSSAREFLFEYLNRPLNSYRHEALVKRLFKLAEKAGDDEVMASFLVCFDRSIRRVKRRSFHTEYQTVRDRDQARAILSKWDAEGAELTNMYEWGRKIHLYGRWAVERIISPRNTSMPRGEMRERQDPWTGRRHVLSDLMERLGLHGKQPDDIRKLPKHARQQLRNFRLFSVHTRHYLRRRAWRYFRKLGKENPERYIKAVARALKRYEDKDVPDGLALIDNWGLLHILFHHSPVLVAKNNGWTLRDGHSLNELSPAPIYESQWRESPRILIDLMADARCRPVRQWAIHWLRKDGGKALANLPLDEILPLLGHEDSEVAALAAEVLPKVRGLSTLELDRWLTLLDTANPATFDTLCELMIRFVRTDQVSLELAVQLAMRRPVPVARLGLKFLEFHRPTTAEDYRIILGLAEAEAESVRPELVRWVRGVLSASTDFFPIWVLDFLDSRHRDVRNEGWAWFQEEPRARDNIELWRRLLESPYDDIRAKLIRDLEERVAREKTDINALMKLEPELVRFLWASVLLNISRGGRQKPLVVQQLVERLAKHPDEAATLLPIISVALRSIRGPEFRAGLAGIVQVVERNAQLEQAVREVFPELKLVV